MVSEAESRTHGTQGGARSPVAAPGQPGGRVQTAQTPATAADGVFRRAKMFHERGALDDAERGYSEALQAEPDHAEALHLLGVLHFQRGRMEEADSAMSRSIERSPSPLALANHASVLLSLDRRDDALARLDAALALNASHPRALMLRAGVLANLSRHQEALEMYDRLIEAVPAQADVLCGRAVVLRALQRHAEALESCERALAIDSRSFNVHRQRGHALRDLGRLGEALDSYGRALAVVPNSAEVLLMQGLTFADLGRLDSALASLAAAIAGHPDFVDAIFNSAVVLERLKRYDDALERCDRVLALDPRHASALANKGNIQHGLKRYTDALENYDASLDIAPQAVEVLCNRAVTLIDLRRAQEALESCARAIACNETHSQAWFQHGRALQRLHRYEEALTSFDRVLAADPDDRPALYHRGNTLRSMMRHEEAIAEYDRVLAIDPEHIVTHFTKAFVYLQMGDLEKGWPEYEWRWREEQVGAHKRAFAQPLWLGKESIEDKTILLHAEQGLGDTLQFCRYVKMVKARGARVIVEAQAPLRSLLATVEGIDQIVAYGDPLPLFDVHCPLLSLPMVFGTTLSTIPADVPYIRADEERIAHWETRLGPRSRPRIGIAWSGNPNHLDDHNRSISLDELLPELADDVEWVSIQKFVRAEEQTLLTTSNVRHFGEEIGDFSDTAALVQCLDCVVSVDTSVAHLAGALGRPLWVMLPYLPDWRWLLDRDDNPWYPNARLFRQAQAGQWSDVFARIRDALRSLPAAVPAALPI
ncbi:Cell division coordinator CpoB [Paraburkholderia humisilvae]|uniref:Cell division coordinator CpoB n=2 Tax=Paraburkholderia humisilvae TaxID=627669 RepID=A0A6J5F547_9BURK|nr:Cell division coordinator CpoB [Paraburkholderia humisilvae]